MNGLVPVAVEDDRGHEAAPPACARGSLAHGGKGGGKVAGGAGGQTGMHADRRVQIGIRVSHDGRSRPAGREARDVDAARIDRMAEQYPPRDAGDQGRLARIAPLIVRAEPVPALLRVGRGGLRRVRHEKAVLLRERVHSRTGGEVVGRLGAAVQHHDERKPFAGPVGGKVELVGARPGCVRVGLRREGGAVGKGIGGRPWNLDIETGRHPPGGEAAHGLAQAGTRPGVRTAGELSSGMDLLRGL